MQDRQSFYNDRARFRPRESNRAYQRLLQKYFQFYIPPGKRVLEVGCGIGDLLAAVRPAQGVGIDFSPEMIQIARQRHPDLQFLVATAEALPFLEPFDYIILSDLVNDLPDVQQVLDHLQSYCHPKTRLVLNFFNTVWKPVLSLAEKSGAKSPTPPQNWLSTGDMKNLLYLSQWEPIKIETRILWPARLPLVASFFNRWVAPILQPLALSIFMVARPAPGVSAPSGRQGKCSVIIPARNEEGNIEAAIQRTPEMGLGTEIIFVEGHSTDKTWEKIVELAARHPERTIKCLKQQSIGKGGAVREGFAAATGEYLFILDADLTMPPEELPKFYEVLRSGRGELVNGVRLVYPMENQAMRFFNLVANKFFSLAFSWLLGQPVKDTLCGTKVLRRVDYEAIAANRNYFGDFDPFGDFDLLFGAAKLNLKIVDLPIRYRARVYGETNIQRWRHGALLFRMILFAARRLKFLKG